MSDHIQPRAYPPTSPNSDARLHAEIVEAAQPETAAVEAGLPAAAPSAPAPAAPAA